jgi:hypothetical protein
MKHPLVVCLFSIGAMALLSTSTGCPHSPIPVIENAIIDCTTQNQDQIDSLLGEFKTLLSGKLPDWSAIYQRAKSAGKSIGGCALAELVQSYLGNKAAPPPIGDSWTANNTLERFRREEAGNATFHTSAGDL